MSKTATEIVHIYLHTIWDKGETALVRQYCADPIVRHDANGMTKLSHDEQIARISDQVADLRPIFTDVVLSGDDEYVTSVWNASGSKPGWALCGIEVFRVRGGRITDVWNSTYMEGAWG